jgi:hypothetical protein
VEDARAQQGRFPTPRGADEGEEPSFDQTADRLGDDVLPAEEELGVGHLESCESLVRADIG